MIYNYIMHYVSCWWFENNSLCLKGVLQNNIKYHAIK